MAQLIPQRRGTVRYKAPLDCPEEPPHSTSKESYLSGTPTAPTRLPPPASSQGSDQQPGFNPLNTGCIDPEPCSAPPCLASPPTPSHLICTALISRPANFSIWLLLTQGAQEMQFPTSPQHAACGRTLMGSFGDLRVSWGPHTPLEHHCTSEPGVPGTWPGACTSSAFVSQWDWGATGATVYPQPCRHPA